MTGRTRWLAATGAGVVFLIVIAFAALLDVNVNAAGDRELAWLNPLDPHLFAVFIDFRLPRILSAVIVGAGLGAAGCAFQALLRNPLAEPYTLGVSSGSALAVVIAIRFGLDLTGGGSGVGMAATLGALATVGISYSLAKTDGRLPPATLLLAGISIAMFCSAATLLLQYTADLSEVYRMIRWMMGGLDAVSYGAAARAGIATVLGVGVLVYLSPDFNALAAGEDAAASIGVNVARTVVLGYFAASLVVGATIAVAGPIGFVGLIVPHALRTLVGPDHRTLVPLSALGGAALLCACDTMAHFVIAPAELPVGVLTAVLGVPFFLFLLFRHKGTGRLWGGQ